MKPEKRPQLQLRKAEIDNPYFARDHAQSRTNPRTIVATVNIKESAISTLVARRLINRAQEQAANRFRMLWEAMGGKGTGAIDYAREHVDGGPIADPISLSALNAGTELKRCRVLLGARGYDLVCKVCGEGLALTEISQVKRDRLTAADNLKAALDDLAEMWNLKVRRRS